MCYSAFMAGTVSVSSAPMPSLVWCGDSCSQPNASELAELLPGHKLGAQLGRGACGVVFAALTPRRAPAPPESSVIKIASAIDARRELRVLQQLGDHRHVVGLRASRFTRRWGALILDPADGDLNALPPKSPSAVRSALWQICNGLHYLHGLRVAHLDLKSSNVLVRNGIADAPRIQLADFSHSALYALSDVDTNVLSHPRGRCTLHYRSVEALSDAAACSGPQDMWALGCIAAELALKKHPFWPASAPTAQSILQAVQTWVPQAASLQPVHEMLGDIGVQFLMDCLALDAKARLRGRDSVFHAFFCAGIRLDFVSPSQRKSRPRGSAFLGSSACSHILLALAQNILNAASVNDVCCAERLGEVISKMVEEVDTSGATDGMAFDDFARRLAAQGFDVKEEYVTDAESLWLHLSSDNRVLVCITATPSGIMNYSGNVGKSGGTGDMCLLVAEKAACLCFDSHDHAHHGALLARSKTAEQMANWVYDGTGLLAWMDCWRSSPLLACVVRRPPPTSTAVPVAPFTTAAAALQGREQPSSPRLGGDAATETPTQEPSLVSHAISLQGAELCEAILCCYKDIENRHVWLRGWVALHRSSSKADAAIVELLRRCIPELPQTSECAPGTVVGLAFFERTVHLADLRAKCHCSDACNVAPGGHHVGLCTLGPFAHGPLCGIISATLRLPQPVACKGNTGLWKLPEGVRAEVVRQLHGALRQEVRRSPDETLPRPWPLPWLAASLGGEGCEHLRAPAAPQCDPRLTGTKRRRDDVEPAVESKETHHRSVESDELPSAVPPTKEGLDALRYEVLAALCSREGKTKRGKKDQLVARLLGSNAD